MTFAALEFDRVLALVASFARSGRGRRVVTTTLPRFTPGEGSSAFRLTREVQFLIAGRGSLGFAGLDAADLLEATTPRPVEAADLARLVTLVRRLVEIRAALAGAGVGPELGRVLAEVPQLEGFLAFCELRLGPGGEVLDSASPALAQARAARERNRAAIVSAMEQIRRQHKALSAPFTLRRERYCVPVPVAERALVPGLVLDASSSGATVYLEPFAVVEPNNALAQATAVARAEEERVLAELASAFHGRREALLHGARTLAILDAAQARALFGLACEGTLLEPGASASLRLVNARHPLLDPTLAALRGEVLGGSGNTRPVVPLELEFNEDTRLVLLSGPNAGGKTVAIKTVGLAALMAQAGIPVLAEVGSGLPSFGKLWCHLGDEQDLFSDLSTFTGAMRAQPPRCWPRPTPTRSCSTTSWAPAPIRKKGRRSRRRFSRSSRAGAAGHSATAHLITVAAHLEDVPGALNAAMGYDEASGRPTYRLHLGTPGRSRGSPHRELVRGSGRPPDTRERDALPLLSRHRRLPRGPAGGAWPPLAGAREPARVRARGGARAGGGGGRAREAHRRAGEGSPPLRRGTRDVASEGQGTTGGRSSPSSNRHERRGEFPGKKRVAALRRSALDIEPEHPAPPERADVRSRPARRCA